jgi:hypothetical protein
VKKTEKIQFPRRFQASARDPSSLSFVVGSRFTFLVASTSVWEQGHFRRVPSCLPRHGSLVCGLESEGVQDQGARDRTPKINPNSWVILRSLMSRPHFPKVSRANDSFGSNFHGPTFYFTNRTPSPAAIATSALTASASVSKQRASNMPDHALAAVMAITK